MAKIKTLAEKPPEARGTPAEQLRQLRDYLYRVMKELEFLLTHLGKDNLAEGLRKEIEGKQEALTFDEAPAEGSENPVTSEGIYDAIQAGGGGSAVQLGTISFSAVWSGESSPYTQVVTVDGAEVTASSKVDLQLTAAQIAALSTSGVLSLLIENNAGALTAWAVGAAPSAAMTVQCTVEEVEA